MYIYKQLATHPEEFLPPVLGLVLTALLKSSPADAEVVHPSPDVAGSDTGVEEAVGFAQSGSPYCPLILFDSYIFYCRSTTAQRSILHQHKQRQQVSFWFLVFATRREKSRSRQITLTFFNEPTFPTRKTSQHANPNPTYGETVPTPTTIIEPT